MLDDWKIAHFQPAVSGCQDAWIAFCALNEKPSVISSFKANRFNNWDNNITFLRDYVLDKNSMLQSVLDDATSDQVAVCLLTLALYFRLTGPYWRLLGSKTLYLDFYKHVVQMKDQLDQWSQNASTIFNAELPPIFAQQMQDCILQGCHPSCQNNKPADHQGLPVTVWGADHRSGSTAERLSASGTLPCSH